METLIDLDPLPTSDDYALWAYHGSGVEQLWPDYPEFLMEYNKAREQLLRRHSDLTEDSFSDRFVIMCTQNPRINAAKMAPRRVVARLHDNLLRFYYSRCFVHEDLQSVLPRLADRYRLGIVSNFKSRGGIEYLLKTHGLTAYFRFVLVSINFGRRKPHPDIYREAIRKSRVRVEEILFIGDDIHNDIVVPRSLGMKTLLLDRYGRHDGRYRKVASFRELGHLLT